MGDDGRESSPLAKSKSGESGVMRGVRSYVDIFLLPFGFCKFEEEYGGSFDRRAGPD